MTLCNILFSKNWHVYNCCRTIYTCQTLNSFRKSHTPTKVELNLKRRDGMSEKYRLVYRTPMLSYINTAYAVSSVSLVSFGALSCWKAYITMGVLGLPLVNILDPELLEYSPLELGTFIGAYLATNVALWIVSSRCVLRIYRDEVSESPSFCCVMVGFLPLTTQKIEFTPGDLTLDGGLSRKMPWKESAFSLGSTKLVLLRNHFRTPADLHDMLKKV